MAEFPDFELVPAEGLDQEVADDELTALLDPAELADAGDEDEDLPIGWTWALDENGHIVQHQTVRGPQAVAVVAQVAMQTRRFDHPELYDDEFGMEHPEALIGHPDDAERRALYLRDIRETLLACHDHITGIGSINFLNNADDEIAYVDVRVEVDGDDEILLEGVALGG